VQCAGATSTSCRCCGTAVRLLRPLQTCVVHNYATRRQLVVLTLRVVEQEREQEQEREPSQLRGVGLCHWVSKTREGVPMCFRMGEASAGGAFVAVCLLLWLLDDMRWGCNSMLVHNTQLLGCWLHLLSAC